MGKKINLILMPSLEHIALVKIGTTLWNRRNIRILIEAADFEEHYEYSARWQEIEENVLENASLLYPTRIFREKITGVIKPLGLQIYEFLKKNFEQFNFRFNDRCEFCWTPEGTLDEKETAKAFANDETNDIKRRYEIACIYCLESEIWKIWNNTPERRRKYLYENPTESSYPFVSFWTRQLQGKKDEIENFIEFGEFRYRYRAVQRFTNDNHKAAAEYVLNVLSPPERDYAIFYIIRSSFDLYNLDWNFLHFLLLQANEEQQLEIFANCQYTALLCLLDFPWQVLFLEMVNHLSSFLNGHYCFMLLERIVNKVMRGFNDYDYQKLFTEFWQKMETAHKKCVTKDLAIGDFLLNLFRIKDVKNISLILKDTSAEDIERIFCSNAVDICRHLAHSREWDLLDFFLQFILSPEEMAVLKVRCDDCFVWAKPMCAEDRLKFFQLFDDLYQTKFNKRNMENQISSKSTKRFRRCST